MPTKKVADSPARFSVATCSEFAYRALNGPPKFDWIERVPPRGSFVAEFYLPLDLCVPFNRIGRVGTASQGWKLGKVKSDAYLRMRAQMQQYRPRVLPLTSRAHVRLIRFSSKPTDAGSGWEKNVIDRLRVGKHGLGILADDSPAHVRVDAWWEPGARSKGFVYCEVFDGVTP